jgi:hypothetical protein
VDSVLKEKGKSIRIALQQKTAFMNHFRYFTEKTINPITFGKYDFHDFH